MTAGTDSPLLAMLRYAEPFAAGSDLASLRRLLAGIQVPVEQKAERLIEASCAEALAGRYRTARTAAMMAFACGARAPRLREQLAARLRTSNDVALLLELIDSSGDPRVIPIPLLVAYAAQLSYVHLQERALQMLDEAKRGDDRYPPVLLARAQVLTYLGREYQMFGAGARLVVVREVAAGRGVRMGLCGVVEAVRWWAQPVGTDHWHGLAPSVALGLAFF